MKAKYYSVLVFGLMLSLMPWKAQCTSFDGGGKQGSQTTVINNYFDNYDYFYSSRINRFHRDYVLFDYYSPVFTDTYWYDYRPFTWGLSIYGWWPRLTFGYNFFSPFCYQPAYYYDYGWYDPLYYDPYYWGYRPYYYSYWNSPVYINFGFGSWWQWGWNHYNHWYGFSRFNYSRPYNHFYNNHYYNDFHTSRYSSGYRDNGYNVNPARRTGSSSFSSAGPESRRSTSTMSRQGVNRTRITANTNTFTPNSPSRRNTETMTRSNSVVQRNTYSQSNSNSTINTRRSSPSNSSQRQVPGNTYSGRRPVTGQSAVSNNISRPLQGNRIQSAGRAPQRISSPGRSSGSFSVPSSAGRRSSFSGFTARSRSGGSSSFGASSSGRGSSVSSGRSISRSSGGSSASHSSRSSGGSRRK